MVDNVHKCMSFGRKGVRDGRIIQSQFFSDTATLVGVCVHCSAAHTTYVRHAFTTLHGLPSHAASMK
jgi:hypothetical protein